ncbi:hypothetical protein CF15_08160 [Pyrodictium occultum]|uniref:Macroglobulin domain-containing protein n=1 Tax=Pyrodictium occultum TaxID=2309 RepID=A0A0V8RRU2_PYROC|nr:carboxypeptidase regulatory-like domain-containing protein [Pyrodictium occultum]KSW10745.1 hypothetical protein CF15_08160 [Pyrodictium occultum]
MRSRAAKRLAGLAAVALVLLAVSQSIVALAALSVSLNKASFIPGDTLVVSGTADPNAVITIKIVDPNGAVKVADQVSAGGDGSFTWSIRLPGDWPTGTYQVVVRNADTGEQQTLTFTLQSGGEIAGRVVDENGSPVAGAEVYVCSGNQTVAEAATGGDGSFTVFVNPGTYCVKVEKSGYTTATVTNVSVGRGERVSLGTLQIRSLESLVRGLEAQVNASLNKLMATLEQLNASVAAAATKEYVDQQLQQLSQLLQSLAEQVKTLQSQLDTKAGKADLEKLAAELSDLNDKLGSLADQLSSLQGQVAGKADQAAVNQLAAKLGDLSDKLDNLSSRVATLEKRVDTLEAATQSIGQLQSAIGQLKSSIDSFRATAASLQSQVSSASSKASSASRLALVGVAAGLIGLIIAIVAVVLVYRKIAG